MTTYNPAADDLRTVASNLRAEGHTSRALLLDNAADEFDAMLEASEAKDKRITEMSNNDAWAVDEFNAGYQAFEQGMDLDAAAIEYRNALPAEVPSFDKFSAGYALAKLRSENNVAAALVEVLQAARELTKSFECYTAQHKPEIEWDEYDYMVLPLWKEILVKITQASS